MNVFTRIGMWLDRQKKASQHAFMAYQDSIARTLSAFSDNDRVFGERLSKHDKEFSSIVDLLSGVSERMTVFEAEKQVPSTTLKEINMLKVRLDRIELLVGLKREPVITNLPDTARIS